MNISRIKSNAKKNQKKIAGIVLSIQEKYLFLHTFSEGEGGRNDRKKPFFHMMPV